MRILIIGDTHAQDDIFLRVLSKERGSEALHIGSGPQGSDVPDAVNEPHRLDAHHTGSGPQGFDVLLHTGDFEGSEIVYRELCGTPFYYIAGNNDFFTEAPYERVIELESLRIYMTHGHLYNVFETNDGILQEAARRHAQIAVYGHSHYPVAEVRRGILLLNPGSLAWPRQEGRRPSYIVLELHGGKIESFEIRYLDPEP